MKKKKWGFYHVCRWGWHFLLDEIDLGGKKKKEKEDPIRTPSSVTSHIIFNDVTCHLQWLHTPFLVISGSSLSIQNFFQFKKKKKGSDAFKLRSNSVNTNVSGSRRLCSIIYISVRPLHNFLFEVGLLTVSVVPWYTQSVLSVRLW